MQRFTFSGGSSQDYVLSPKESREEYGVIMFAIIPRFKKLCCDQMPPSVSVIIIFSWIYSIIYIVISFNLK